MRGDIAFLLGAIVLALLTMPLYGAGSRNRHDPHEIADRGGFVLGGFVRNWFYWFVAPVEWAAHALRLSPTTFNLLGVAFGVAAGCAFAVGATNLGGWLVLLGGVADVLDGRIARARGEANETGAFLDSTLDRFAEVGAFVGLAVMYRGESLGVVAKVGIMQRAERLLAVGFGAILDPAVTELLGWSPGSLLLGLIGMVAAGATGTAIYRTIWIAKRLD